MTRKFKAVIFDWSGTLSDDFEACYLTFCDNLRHFGCTPVSRAAWKEMARIPFAPIYNKLGVIAPDEEIARKFRDHFERYSSMPKPYPDTKSTLKWLKERGVETAVLSAHHNVKREAEEFGILEYLDLVGEAVMNKVEVIHDFLGQMHTANNETLFVGDMVHDIETARHAGIAVAVVLHGYDSEEKLRAARPDYVIKTIGGLKNLGLF